MQQRSTFVTAVAWVFIVLSGFSTVIGILQNIMVQTVFRGPQFEEAMRSAPADMPPFAAFMFSHFQLFFLLVLLLSAFTLISSIGLLKRLNWARLCFIGVMVFGIVYQLGGLVIQFLMFSAMREQFSAAAAQGGPDMQVFFVGIAVVSLIFATAFCVLFGWIARKLMSPAIVEEFR